MSTVQKSFQIHTIVTHAKPHLDEWAAICILRMHGRSQFLGIEKARIEVFDSCTTHNVATKTESQWLEEGYLFVGVGGEGWQFVDHPHVDHIDECAFTMVLKCLGLDEDPAWRQVSKEVLQEDRNGAPSPLHIACLIKAANEYMNPAEAEVKIPEMVGFFLLGAYKEKQTAFHEALDEQKAKDVSDVIDVTNEHSNATHTLAVVCSDNSETAAVARFLGATLVVHVRDVGLSSQQVYISCNKKHGLRRIHWLAAQIRREEQKRICAVTDESFEELGHTLLASDGELLGWCHQEVAGALFWGALTVKRVEKTRLSVEEITDLATQFLRGTRNIRSQRQKR